MKITDMERFESLYTIDSDSGCHNWIGFRDKDGYGKFKSGRRAWRAHRWIYEQFIGELKDGMQVCHDCGNTSCVNPLHLRQDTISNNQIDNFLTNSHPSQKLKTWEVREIREKLKYMKCRDIAREYNVSIYSIYSIKQGKSFGWLT
jgi:hypothetical protein